MSIAKFVAGARTGPKKLDINLDEVSFDERALKNKIVLNLEETQHID